MSDEPTNVLRFEPRPAKVPELKFVELRLNKETCGIEMTVVDETGATFVLAYRLSAIVPEGFDLDRLVAAWEGWKGCVGRAS